MKLGQGRLFEAMGKEQIDPPETVWGKAELTRFMQRQELAGKAGLRHLRPVKLGLKPILFRFLRNKEPPGNIHQ